MSRPRAATSVATITRAAPRLNFWRALSAALDFYFRALPQRANHHLSVPLPTCRHRILFGKHKHLMHIIEAYQLCQQLSFPMLIHVDKGLID